MTVAHTKTTPLYLSVAYADKDLAKRLGARWNPSVKKWWAPDGSAIAELMRRRAVHDPDLKRSLQLPQSLVGKVLGWASAQTYASVFPDTETSHRNLTDFHWRTLNALPGSVQSEPANPDHAATDRYYLNVPYRDKELAKRYGAKWDAHAGLWYATRDSEIAGYHRLQDSGLASMLIEGDHDESARLYAMAERGAWTAAFGDDAQKQAAGLKAISFRGQDHAVQAATNSDVLSRFGRRGIMIRAYSYFNGPISKTLRGRKLTFAEALKASWASYRGQIDQERAARADQTAQQVKHGKQSLLAQPRRANSNRLGQGAMWVMGS